MKDILLSVVFMLNIGFIVLFAIDFLKRYKTNYYCPLKFFEQLKN